MIKIGAIGFLFLSVVLMIRGISETWKDRALPETQIQGKKTTTLEDVDIQLPINPTLPTDLPNFKSGYLFNEKRTLEEEKGQEEEPEEQNLSGNDVGIQTDLSSSTFSGAIIADTFTKAIITYTPAPKKEAKSSSRRASRLSRNRRSSAKKGGPLQTTQLMLGDIISGYKVASIEPDKIIYKKGDEIIEKYIYDPNKQRAKPVARSRPAAVAPPRPEPGAPVTAPPAPGSQRAAATPSPTAPPSPGAKAASQRRAVTARRPSTARRLVVSRKPPPKPDTSRVSRRRRSAGSPAPTMPATPGGPPTM